MKKIVVFVVMLVSLMMASVCLAGENGSALNKIERTTDKMIAVFLPGSATTYAEVAKGFTPELKEKLTVEAFDNIKKEVSSKFGTIKETKMVSFERFDAGERVVYLAGFTKEKVVSLMFLFNKSGAMTNFALSPVQVQEQQGK